jgi:hypothetical protein
MTGYPHYNFQAFNRAARELRALGWSVFNPAESFDGDITLGFSTYLRHDMKVLVDCDVIILLDGWPASPGARLEHAVATACGLARYTWIDGELLPLETPGKNRREELATLMGVRI